AAKARSVKVGNGLDEGTELGPINNKPQFERVKGLVAEAIEQGAVAVAGGHPIEGDGYFFGPTILTNLAEGTRIVWVNTHMQLTHDAPFTGMKWSGLGSEMGLEAW
ncbi:MAG TPA: aldehyde dehydrogenase family protein, partial [Trebonia sp.]